MELKERLQTYADGETIARFVETQLQRPVIYLPNVEPDPQWPARAETGVYGVSEGTTLTQLTTALLQIPHTAVWVCPPPAEPVPDEVILIPAPTPDDCHALNTIWEPLQQFLKTVFHAMLTETDKPLDEALDPLFETDSTYHQLERLTEESAFVRGYFLAVEETLERGEILRVAWVIHPEAFRPMKDPGYQFLMEVLSSRHIAPQFWIIQGGWPQQYHA